MKCSGCLVSAENVVMRPADALEDYRIGPYCPDCWRKAWAFIRSVIPARIFPLLNSELRRDARNGDLRFEYSNMVRHADEKIFGKGGRQNARSRMANRQERTGSV